MRSIPVSRVGLALGLAACISCAGLRGGERDPGEASQALEAPAAGPTPATSTTHRVARGDTLWGVAAKYGSCVSALLTENGIRDVRRVWAGMELRVPDASACDAAPRSGPEVARLRVRRGDTVSEIALLYGTSSRALLEANGIRDARRVRAGSELVVPLGAGAHVVPPPRASASAPRAAPKSKPQATGKPRGAAEAKAAAKPSATRGPKGAAEPTATHGAMGAPEATGKATEEGKAKDEGRAAGEPGTAAAAKPRAEASGAETEAPPSVGAPPPASADANGVAVETALLRSVDDALDVAELHLRTAHFEEALADVEDAFWLLDSHAGEVAGEAQLAAARRARGHVLAATVKTAFGQDEAARQSLAAALVAEPELELDRRTTPPRVLRLFDAVRSESGKRVARSP